MKELNSANIGSVKTKHGRTCYIRTEESDKLELDLSDIEAVISTMKQSEYVEFSSKDGCDIVPSIKDSKKLVKKYIKLLKKSKKEIIKKLVK